MGIGKVIFEHSDWNLSSDPSYKASLFQSIQLDQRLPHLTLMAMRVLTSGTVAANCANQQTYTNSTVSHVSHNDAVHRE